MYNKNLVNIAIHHIKEEDSAHGIGELKRGLYNDINGIHIDVNTVKADLVEVGNGVSKFKEDLGDMAWEDRVELAKLGTTIIQGGYIKTDLIKAHSIGARHINTSELIVGDNITLGPNAVISFSNLSQEVIDEFDVGKMEWLGEYNTFPPNPKINNAFYHTIDLCSYIYDGLEWRVIAKDGSVGPRGPKGDKGDSGTDGSYYAPSYLKSTYISSTEIQSPLITGNTGRFADTVYVGQNDGSNNKAGISALGTTDSSIRFWAGNANKLTAPFRVTQGGSVTMTDANVTGIIKSSYGSYQNIAELSSGGLFGKKGSDVFFSLRTFSYKTSPTSPDYYRGSLALYSKESSNSSISIDVEGSRATIGSSYGTEIIIKPQSFITSGGSSYDAAKSYVTVDGGLIVNNGIASNKALYVYHTIYAYGGIETLNGRGVSGSFVSSDGKTITVVGGIITGII